MVYISVQSSSLLSAADNFRHRHEVLKCQKGNRINYDPGLPAVLPRAYFSFCTKWFSRQTIRHHNLIMSALEIRILVLIHRHRAVDVRTGLLFIYRTCRRPRKHPEDLFSEVQTPPQLFGRVIETSSKVVDQSLFIRTLRMHMRVVDQCA